MEPTEFVVAVDGDIILTLHDNKQTSLARVSSAILCQTSKVFTAMLGPAFNGGQAARSQSQPKHIDLPDDNGNAMLRFCHVLHFNTPLDDLDPLANTSFCDILAITLLMPTSTTVCAQYVPRSRLC
jgi:hypothetical protein